MCMPFINREFTFSQPNGTSFKALGRGNQHRASFTTLDGYAIARDVVSGFFHYVGNDGEPLGVRVGAVDPTVLGLRQGAARVIEAGLSAVRSRWQIRREEFRVRSLAAMANGMPLAAPPQQQTVGTYVGLCLLIDFPDLRATITQPEVTSFCNQPGYGGFGNNGSVRDYFLDVSGGKLDYSNIVTPWYTAKHPRAYYTNEAVQFTVRAQELIQEALAFHKARGFDFSGLTTDGLGFVRAINVFYAGSRENQWSQGLWPHSFALQNHTTLAPGKRAHDYQITDMTDQLTLGTFCHENGHMICDFPDLYDYDGNSFGVGAYCLMCAGDSFNARNPVRIGAYLAHAAGWATAITDMTPGQTIRLAAGKNEFGLLHRNKTQYFIVENRHRSGRDASLPDEGLAIWKIDTAGSNSNESMTATSHYECSLMQADGRFQIEHKINLGDDGDLYGADHEFSDQSRPGSRWWDGTSSNLRIHSISQPGPVVTYST